MKRIGPLLTVCLLAVAATQVAAPQGNPVPEDWRIDNSRWSEPVGSTTTVTIRNLFGDLRVRPTGDDQIALSAMIQRHRDDPRRAEVQHSIVGDTFELEVGYPPVADLDPGEVPASWRRRRVDLTVFVPAGRNLIIETAAGLIEIKGLADGVEARSASGDIALDVGGPVDAHTERGAIRVQFKDTRWPAGSTLQTLTGDIAAWLPPQANATAHLETFGEITTDYSIAISRQPGSTRKSAVAVVGDGGARLSLTSNRGSLKLLRSPY
jgi:hypothetical protein